MENKAKLHPISLHILNGGQEGEAYIDCLIYNRDELHALPEESDEQLLLRTVRERGWGALAGINGDFAGAVYEHGHWVLFRDHFGVRPLYYYADASTFAISSDYRDFCTLPGVDLSVNEKKLYLDMVGGSSHTLRETEFERIRCVCPSSYGVVEQGQVQETIYWKLKSRKIRLKDDQAYFDELYWLVSDAVRRRAEVFEAPLGAELSGGLDSSVIDILLCRMGYDVHFVSWSAPYDERSRKEGDEREIVEEIAELYHKPVTFLTQKDNAASVYEDKQYPPYVNTLTITQTSECMREQGVYTVFTGQGGDEGVSHRCSVLELFYQGEPIAFLHEIYRRLRQENLRLLRTIWVACKLVCKVLPTYFKEPRFRGTDYSWINPGFMQANKKTRSTPFLFGIDPAFDINSGGIRDRQDNAAVQAGSVGVRYLFPFLDYRVMDFAISIPRRMYLHGDVNRYIYRQAFRDIMPQKLQEVNYKDDPSMRGEERFLNDKAKEDILRTIARLDEKRWSKYLDVRSTRERITEAVKKGDLDSVMEVVNIIMTYEQLVSIQHMQDRAAMQ